MATMTVKCPYCRGEDVVKHGKTPKGIQVFRCRSKNCERRKFQLEYKYQACYPDTTEKIIKMAVNGAGISDTERVLGIHHTTIISRLKKRKEISNK